MPTDRIGARQGCQQRVVVHVSPFLNHAQARQAWDIGFSGLLQHKEKQLGGGPAASVGVQPFSARLLRQFVREGFSAVGLSVGAAKLHTPADAMELVQPTALHVAARLLLATIWQLERCS
ncbi:MAG TPA: hypothetical protein VFV38_12665 [Ktedonobacteraceae bacterium]|nr:hypothetical protein [Ktedonobacteraceae bacterium]